MLITTVSKVPGILHITTLNPANTLKEFITIPHATGEETEDQKGFANLPEVTWLMVIGFKHACD